MILVDIVCPIYKNIEQIKSLYHSILLQEDVKINKVVFPFTLSGEEVDEEIRSFLKENRITYFEVEQKDFSHSLTREKAVREYCSGDVVIYVSQDVKLIDPKAFHNISSVINDEVIYAFGKQICEYHSIERYIRKKNYPKKSYIVSTGDIEKMQLIAFYASDAFSCLSRKHFIELGGYNGHNVMMSEDMLYSKILLDAGYKKAYVAEAVVAHSHKYTIKQLYRRYYALGIFHEQNKVFDQYKTNVSGMKLAFYVLGQALIHFNIPVLFRWLPDMTARYLGMKKGRKAA